MKGEYSEPFISPELEDTNKLYNIVSEGGEVVECNLTYEQAIEKNQNLNCNIVEVNKAIMAEGSQTTMESVEGGQEKLKNLVDSNRNLKKSEIYDSIWAKYPNVIFDIEKSKQIFELINKVGQKYFNMENNEITEDVIKKSYEILDSTIDLMKSKSNELEENTEEVVNEEVTEEVKKSEETQELVKAQDLEDEDEDMIKKMAKKRLDKGMDAKSCVDDMVSKGISLEAAQTTVEKILSELKAIETGGTVTEVSINENKNLVATENSTPMDIQHLVPAIVKGVIDELSKLNSNESLESLIKSQTSEIGTRFHAISNIQKSFEEKIDNLSKGYENSITELREEINKIGDMPAPRKSATRVVEKFEKGHDDGSIKYSLSNKEEKGILNDMLFEKAVEIQQLTGRSNPSLEKAIQDIEAAGSMDDKTYAQIKPILKSMNIDIIK